MYMKYRSQQCYPELGRDIKYPHSYALLNAISINLSPSYRGKGLGKSLLHYSLERFKKDVSNAYTVKAIVKSKNSSSNALFSKYGFDLVHQSRSINEYLYDLKSFNKLQ